VTPLLYSPHWLVWAQTQALVALFSASHIEMCFVGGAVRDAVVAREAVDIGMVTSASADYVVTVLSAAGIPTERRHGALVMFIDGKRYHLYAMPDCDRHEAFLMRVKLHIERTVDFTVNALFMTAQGELHDYFDGARDAHHGRIIFVRLPEMSLGASPYQILRYFRMVAVFGNGEVDVGVVALCRKYRESLRSIAPELRYTEVLEIAMAPDAVHVLRVMLREGILCEALGYAVQDLQAFEHLLAIEGMLRIQPDLETRLLLFAALATIPAKEALVKLTQHLGWSEDMLVYYGWIAEQLQMRSGIDPQWRETMGEKGFRRLVMGAWAMEEDILECSADYARMW